MPAGRPVTAPTNFAFRPEIVLAPGAVPVYARGLLLNGGPSLL